MNRIRVLKKEPMDHQKVSWHVGSLPTVNGWYLVAKVGEVNPDWMRFDLDNHANWTRVLAWDGPFTIPMTAHSPSLCMK